MAPPAATLRNAPLCEYCHPEIYPDQELRRNLFGPEPTMVDGVFELPTAPGLGVDVDIERLRAHPHVEASKHGFRQYTDEYPRKGYTPRLSETKI